MEMGPKSFNSLFLLYQYSVYGLLSLPVLWKDIIMLLSCPQTLEVYSLNPKLPFVTQFRAQYYITSTFTL